MKRKKGDTLIEVALAIGIFSLVAITVVSVVSASLGGSQSSLEVTVTREELDAQAEALRFIHDSYVSGTQSKKVTDNVYGKVWEALTNLAVNESEEEKKSDSPVLNYNPETCASTYNGNTGLLNTNPNTGGTGAKPFIINTRELNTADPAKIIISSESSATKGVFYEATTYPRIIYGDIIGNEGDDYYSQTTSEESSGKQYLKIKRVEGIFVTVVRGTSSIVKGGTVEKDQNSYYDFYIHSCWMPPNVDRASTISTVVRLYDPAVITY